MYEIKLDSSNNYIITLTETTVIPYPKKENTEDIQKQCNELAELLSKDLNAAIIEVIRSPVMTVDEEGCAKLDI